MRYIKGQGYRAKLGQGYRAKLQGYRAKLEANRCVILKVRATEPSWKVRATEPSWQVILKVRATEPSWKQVRYIKGQGYRAKLEAGALY